MSRVRLPRDTVMQVISEAAYRPSLEHIVFASRGYSVKNQGI